MGGLAGEGYKSSARDGACCLVQFAGSHGAERACEAAIRRVVKRPGGFGHLVLPGKERPVQMIRRKQRRPDFRFRELSSAQGGRARD